jgi:hypothetical protein
MTFTQGFLVGLYTDYNRFLYFIILPVVILIAIGIDHGAGFFARIISTYRSFKKETVQIEKSPSDVKPRRLPSPSRRNIYSGFVIGFLLFSFLFVPFFLTPFQGATIQSFYQVMNDPRYEAIQWARQNTPVGSVFVSDALYGWWFSGFAQRPTLSAVDPQYLTLAREFEPAKAAKSLLDTDYLIDNGLIQVREDGGYIGRHNPMFLAKLNWTYFPYPFFHFNNGETTVFSRKDSDVESFDLTELQVKEMRIENNSDYASILVSKGNNVFNYTQQTTVYRGVRFVNMSITVESSVDGVALDWVRFILHTKGEVIQRGNSVGLLDEGAKVLGQLIFAEKQPSVYAVTYENPSGLELLYNMQGQSKGEIQVLVGVFSVTNDQAVYQDPETKANYINKVMDANLNSYQEKVADLPLDVFDYQKALKDWNISYVANRDSALIPKFANDPAFSLVFINNDVAIFMVKHSFSQVGRTPSP